MPVKRMLFWLYLPAGTAGRIIWSISQVNLPILVFLSPSGNKFNIKVHYIIQDWMSLNGFGRVVSFVSRSEVRSRVLEDVLRGPKTPSELAIIEKRHVSHVSRALAELRAQGLVEPISSQNRPRYYRATDLGFLMAATFTKTR